MALHKRRSDALTTWLCCTTHAHKHDDKPGRQRDVIAVQNDSNLYLSSNRDMSAHVYTEKITTELSTKL